MGLAADAADTADDGRKRVPTACEACRTAKIRCRPSPVAGVCQKCLGSRRECVSRTCPRPRRRKQNPGPEASSGTFTIDFASAVEPEHEPDDGAELLRRSHADSLDRLLNPGGGFDADPGHVGDGPSPASASSSSAPPRLLPVHDGHAQPLFNLESAESLLRSFRRTKLAHLPCLHLPADASVPALAASRPFVLLAILTASSASRMPQSHGLYDGEFRRVLGHKYVVGGERSLELLQGILIYSAWYPFHLRPKEKQGFQYMRMATDILADLELAPELPADVDVSAIAPTDLQLEGIRAYLTYVHITSTHLICWKSKVMEPNLYNACTATYCDVLEKHARLDGDMVLAAISRNSCMLHEAFLATHECADQQHHHRRLILSGLRAKLQEARAGALPAVASSVTFTSQRQLIDIYLDCGSLLRIPRGARTRSGDAHVLPLVPATVSESVAKLAALLDHIAALDDESLLCFTIDDWVRFILVVILSLRLSFPMPEHPELDDSWARSQLRFDHFLERMCGATDPAPASKHLDILASSRVILGVVRDKYHRRLRALEETQVLPPEKANGCPMFDADLAPYLPLWEAELAQMTPSSMMVLPGFGDGPADSLPVFHDLWDTMTMNWADGDLG